MPKPSMPNIPGIGAMTDTLDFVKNLWGGMNLPGMGVPGMGMPGMIMPTLSVEEINKQISDLKAVESWLTLNMNMLRGTIQGLEVQSATISTLQSMGESLSAAVKPNPEKKPVRDVPSFSKAMGKAPEVKAAHAPEMDPANDEEADESGPAIPFKAPPKTAPAVDAKPAAAGSAVPLANPAMWWNMLQDQFKQAVNTALASEKMVAPPNPTSKAPAKSSTKPEATVKKTVAPRQRKTPNKSEK